MIRLRNITAGDVWVLLFLFLLTELKGLEQPPSMSPLETYEPGTNLSGTLSFIGSDTLNGVISTWAATFRFHHPGVSVEVEGKGSSTAPPALITGTAQLGPMSRPMTPNEKLRFQTRHGYEPMEIRVAKDAIGIFVHHENSLETLSLTQLDGLFSVQRRRGGESIRQWDQLDIEGPMGLFPVSLYTRNSASGTYLFFRSTVLRNGNFRPTIKERPGSSLVLQAVADDPYSLGFCSIGYSTAGIKLIRINNVFPTIETVNSGDYPLSRFLYIYVNINPFEKPDRLLSEFIRMILSKEGQNLVSERGYFPLTSDIARSELEKLGI